MPDWNEENNEDMEHIDVDDIMELFNQLPEDEQSAVYEAMREMHEGVLAEEASESFVQTFLREELKETEERLSVEERAEWLIKRKVLKLLKRLSRQERFALFDQTVFHSVVKGYLQLALQNSEVGPDVRNALTNSLNEVMERYGAEDAERAWLITAAGTSGWLFDV